jgi:hypothetical protein
VSAAPWTPDQRPAWFDRAACSEHGIPVDVFYPTSNDTTDHRRKAVDDFRDGELAAKQICRDCPVRTECLVYGLHEPYGVWGGRTYRERRRIRRQRLHTREDGAA